MERAVVYNTGGCYSRREYKPCDPRVFATLIIQPFSDHTGGDLIVYDVNSESHKIADFGRASGKRPFAIHFASHLVGSIHEFHEITSGYCFELVYSLSCAQGLGIFILKFKRIIIFDLNNSLIIKRSRYARSPIVM